MKEGWCNIYADLRTGKICETNLNFYESEEEARTAIYFGYGIVKIATIFIKESEFKLF
jgi:hypothetical protein